MLRTSVVVLAAASFNLASAQPAFRSGVDLVTVQVSVSPSDSTRQIGELDVADFRVFDDGVLQTISILDHDPRPISLCILLDSSPSMASGRQTLAIRTVDTLLGAIGPDDEATLLFFASTVRVVLPWTPGRAIRPISWIEWRPSLGTALIDALKEALNQIERASNPVPVIVVVSDGGENASGTSLAKLVASRRQSEALVFGIDTELAPSRTAPLVNRAFSDFLPALVGDSGGTVYSVRSPEVAEGAARAVLRELRSQYTIGYVPRYPPDGKYHRLKVELVNRDLVVRHRGGYLAQPAGQ